jgi:plastocyanin
MSRRVGVVLFGVAVLVLVGQLALGSGPRPPVTSPGVEVVGTISGSIRYTGTAPERAVVQMAADPFCVTAHAGQEVLTEQLVVNDNDTLRWAFVHIRDASGSLPSGAGTTAVLDQVACMYTPRVVGMEAGATIRVTNSDQTLHNVNVQPANNTSFNVAQPIPGMSTERIFENPEIMIPVRCDVHPWMQAYVGVVPHPFFDVTGEDGSFRLEGVPAGEYVIEAWHETLGVQTMNVTVRDGETAAADLTFGGDR